MAKKVAPDVQAHLEWLGFVQPTGLVVSPMALSRQGVILPRNDKQSQDRLLALVPEEAKEPGSKIEAYLPDFVEFTRSVLGWTWKAPHFAGTAEQPIPEDLRHHLEDYEETLAPDFAVADRDPAEGACPWQLLVRVLDRGQDLDHPVREGGHYEASPHARLERLLRAVGAPAGLLFNGHILRLISAPRGESSGWIDFRVPDMVQTAGRPVCSALVLLLHQSRLLTGAKSKRLPALLADSREYQNEVSEQLAQQVMHALYELLRGLEAADARSEGELLRGIRREDPDQVYRALLTVLLRLVFLLYAEERGMLPRGQAFLRHYSLVGLHRRLSEDAALHPDTMDSRFGAWAQLIVLFRMIHDGAAGGELRIPARHGALFDPDRFPFLEGRSSVGARQVGERLEYPRIPDGAIQRVLEKLLVLEGERLSYRALDVEQIGSVYETMMGFRIETATGTSVAVAPDGQKKKKGAAPTTIDLDALLQVEGNKRAKWVQDRAERKLSKTVVDPLKAAATLEELHAALDRVLDKEATPDLLPRGSLVLQPSDARRKSGSHYTPRELTKPIVRTTLRPVLERLREEAGGPPTPEQILDLKVCDPAMGSGAFLVEACRQLGDALIEAWTVHDARPAIPDDEDEVIHARRLVAQRCVYGVDRNPVAVDLAKVSLWLATLARDHAFTFVDHALRCGDSLVGLTNAQIANRDWSDAQVVDSERYRALKAKVESVVALRRSIREAGDRASDWELRDVLDEADHKAGEIRTWADLIVEAFFSADKEKARRQALSAVARAIGAGVETSERPRSDGQRGGHLGWVPFHWQLEFPEVFDRDRFGFDAVVGNPPFQGGRNITASQGARYAQWIVQAQEGMVGGADLAAHFFRRAFGLLRDGGSFGLISTNTIAQGDTRSSGLRWICEHGGCIFAARKRVKWPGPAAVVVSVVHVQRGVEPVTRSLDGRAVPEITAFLFHRGGNGDPVRLRANKSQSFQGSIILGMGFTFDDTDKKGVASSLSDMQGLIAANPRSQEVIYPYIGGAEVNDDPRHAHHRYVINFGEREETECRRDWPELTAVVESRVKPARVLKASGVATWPWWRFWRERPELYRAMGQLDRVLVTNCGATPRIAFAFQPTDRVFANSLAVVVVDSWSGFAALQSRPHELWARFFGSSMKDDLRYTPSDCFETFPFPVNWKSREDLESVGRDYYEFRAKLMVETGLGLTKTYNRFHDPEEADPMIARLRELHAAMDRAVLDAYGWTDVSTDCEFILDYEEDEGVTSKRKKPWRYRWPDEVHDEVLARLLELNAKRAEEERAAEGGSEGKDLFE